MMSAIRCLLFNLHQRLPDLRPGAMIGAGTGRFEHWHAPQSVYAPAIPAPRPGAMATYPCWLRP